MLDAAGTTHEASSQPLTPAGDPAADRPDRSGAGAPPAPAGNLGGFRLHVAERPLQGHDPAQRRRDRGELRARSRPRRSPPRGRRRRPPLPAHWRRRRRRRHLRSPHGAAAVSRSTARRAIDRAVPPDGRQQGLGSPPVREHAAADAQGRPHPAARSGRGAADARRHRGADGADHAGDQSRRVRAAQRHRLRLRDQGPGALSRQHVSRSQGPRRGVPRHPGEDPDRRRARAVAAHPASCAG